MLEVLPCPFTGLRSPGVWISAVYILGAGDGVGGVRGEGYGIDYLGCFGDGVVG